VEFLMALKKGAFSLTEPQFSLAKRIWVNEPSFFVWSPPDDSGSWPEKVLVVGCEGRKVLFNAGPKEAFGVGCLSETRTISNARVYPSLSRALHAFPAHVCPSEV